MKKNTYKQSLRNNLLSFHPAFHRYTIFGAYIFALILSFMYLCWDKMNLLSSISWLR